MSSTAGFGLDISEEDVKSVTLVNDLDSSVASMSNESIEPVEGFTYFPKLPAEIRLKIWKDALPGPRVIRIQLKFDPKPPRIEGQKKKPQVSRFVASRPPPIGLRVCRESRIEALKEYEIGFRTKTSPAQTYVNYDLDTFVLDTLGAYFPYTSRMTMNGTKPISKRKRPVILHREFSKIRFLVIDERFLWSADRLLTQNNFPCLEMVSIVVFDKSTPSLTRGFYDLEERDRPQQPERTGPSLVWINAWLDAMSDLAQKADANHVSPLIRFVNLIRGSGGKETKDKKTEVITAVEEELPMGLVQSYLKMDGTLES
jgi:hypothetical protein